jgi:hypothetical protein
MLAAGALALFSASGCFVGSFFVPISKTPADQAHGLDAKCRGFSDPGSLSLLIPDNAIDRVEGAYSHVVDPPADHLRGAKILVRPLPGVSKESLTRSLECHQASVVLGKAPAVENDPYTLPQRWVDIDVDSEGDAFVVFVRADEFRDAQKVLARAKDFLAAVRSAPAASPALSASPPAASPPSPSPSASPAATVPGTT